MHAPPSTRPPTHQAAPHLISPLRIGSPLLPLLSSPPRPDPSPHHLSSQVLSIDGADVTRPSPSSISFAFHPFIPSNAFQRLPTPSNALRPPPSPSTPFHCLPPGDQRGIRLPTAACQEAWRDRRHTGTSYPEIHPRSRTCASSRSCIHRRSLCESLLSHASTLLGTAQGCGAILTSSGGEDAISLPDQGQDRATES